MPAIAGALLGFMLGGVIGNFTYGPLGAIVGCTLGGAVGSFLFLAFGTELVKEKIKK